MKKQLALDWYYDQTVVQGKTNYAELLEQAKEMERKQLEVAYNIGTVRALDAMLGGKQATFTDYYHENYGEQV